MAKLGLSSPWVMYYRKLNALFKRDIEVQVIYNEDENEISLYVENSSKAAVLSELLPVEKDFGNVKIKIKVVPANNKMDVGFFETDTAIDIAFRNNEIVSFIKTVDTVFGQIIYVVFKNEVVQFYSDDLGDYYGVCSTLAQDIAREVFDCPQNVHFCTDIRDNDFAGFGTPLGEWP